MELGDRRYQDILDLADTRIVCFRRKTMLRQFKRKLIVMVLTFVIRAVFYPDGLLGLGVKAGCVIHGNAAVQEAGR